MKDIEIEFKINILEPQKFRKWLKANCKFIKDTHQIDYYFQPPHRDFLIEEENDAREWLRVRSSDKGNDINYKHWHVDENGRSTYCDELEVHIDNFETAKNIFYKLGYRDFITMDKKREIWMLDDIELAVDTVKGLPGLFVDIEYKGESEDAPEKILKGMIDKFKALPIGEWKKTKRGYAYMMINPDKEHYEEA
jgi:predicted adenylyl cyclase CyaB